MNNFEKRPGEIALDFDPAEMAEDAKVVFIGTIRTPWKTRDECPKNLRQARERGVEAVIEVGAAWRAGLSGLEEVGHLVVLYWMHEARRDLIVQAPRHREEPAGVFSLRSPARPNPIAIATVKVLELDKQNGRIAIDAIDCLDGTPLIDIKPWLERVDQAVSSAQSS
ncbi:MAG: tRNA (N6-threonylcarbamoyladenosine(37)-N6)-methyltransferase TrmO [Hyphomicrobiales bacterium]